jgi:hypothetical protein
LTIQDLGSIGELIAALATVATLAYLAVQIRQNTRSLRASAYQDTVRAANEWGALFVHHPETVAIFREGVKDPDSLDPAAAVEFTHILETFFRNYATAQVLARDGLIPRNICDLYESSIRKWFSSPKLREWWNERSPIWGQLVDSLVAA